MKDRIARSVFWMFWSRGGVQTLAFLATIFVARLLNPGDYGLMALATIWIGSIELLAEMGLGAAVVQFRDLDDSELNACFWVTMGVACTGYGALFFAAPAITRWFSAPAALTRVLRVAGLTLPFVAVRVVPDGLLRKWLALDKISQAEIAASLTTIPVTVGLAHAGAGVWALVGGALTMPLVQTAVTFYFAHWKPGFRVHGPRFGQIIRYSAASLGTRIGWGLLGQTDELVLGKVGGHVVLGFYSMAMRLAMLPVSKITVVANQLVIPIMAELQEDREGMRASFLRGLRMVACLTVPLCVGGALVAPDLIPTVLTAKWVPVVPILQVLSVFALVRSVGALLPPVYYARYRVTSLLRWTTGQLIVMPIVFFFGARWWGALGVAVGWAVVYPIVMALMARQVIHELDLTWKTVWEQVRPLIVAAVLMAVVVLAFRAMLPATDAHTRLIRLVVATGVGALVYGLAIFLQRGPLFDEIMEVISWVFRRGHPVATSK